MRKTLAGCLLTLALVQGAESAKEQYSRAVFAVNAGRLAEAKQLLDTLLTSDPSYYRAYDLLWDVLSKSGRIDEAVLTDSLQKLRNVPQENRTEEYYIALIRALDLLKRKDEASAARAELSQRFPHGQSAQTDLLTRARQEADPAKSVALYTRFLTDYSGNPTQAQIAARERLVRMAEVPDAFPFEALTSTLDDADAMAKQQAASNPYAYVFELRRIAAMLVEKQPQLSVDACRRALRFIDETWLKTAEFDETARYPLLVIELRAYVQLRDVAAASRLAASLIRTLENDPALIAAEDEMTVRNIQAVLLETSGARLAAAEQRRLAAPDQIQLRRLAAARRNVTAQAMAVKAPTFHLVSLQGDPVSLEDFRGKPVVLAFWASWCKPCTEELPALQRWSKRWPQVNFVTITVDEQKSKAEDFVRTHGITLPVLLADASAQEVYETDALPKLYVVDAQGTLRFARTGSGPLSEFERELGWMIETISPK